MHAGPAVARKAHSMSLATTNSTKHAAHARSIDHPSCCLLRATGQGWPRSSICGEQPGRRTLVVADKQEVRRDTPLAYKTPRCR
eukprot:2089177-Prymnesium_polylepis.1